jgi:transcriptional regulator with XRE-family HTH domain
MANADFNDANKDRPKCGLKVRQFRDQCHLTQQQLAKELRTTNVSIARWEGGTREPNEKSCLALAEFSNRKGLLDFGSFFERQAAARKTNAKRKREEEQALHDLEAVERFAAEGDLEAQKIIQFSRLHPVEYCRQINERIQEARRNLGNGAYVREFRKIMDQDSKASALHRARNVRGRRCFEILKRQCDRLQPGQLASAEIREDLRRRVEEILAEAKAALSQGILLDPIAVASRVVQALEAPTVVKKQGRSVQTLELGEIPLRRLAEVYEEIVIEEAQGLLQDGMVTIAKLEQALGLEHDATRKSKKEKS